MSLRMNKFDLFKGFSGSLLTFLLCFIFTASLFAEKKEVEKRGKQVILWFDIRDLITDAVVTDTITIDLMYPDSTLIYTKKLRIWNNRRTGAIENTTVFTGYGRDFLVRLSHPDYETVIKPVHVKEKAKYAQVPLRIRRLTKREKQKATMLDEVVVTSSVVEFVHKGDTIQFNADAFELAEGSMLSALISRLPGAELRENGQIYINNRFVDKLLLDGKDFFKNDKLVLLQNLPAYTVKNIQVYEERSKDELARKGSSIPDYVMNVRLKKEFNAGWLANAEAGGGTHDRFRLRGFGLLYNSKSRFAVYALANNLNETGSPDMEGEWSKKNNKRNEIITRGGGFDYFVEPKKDRRFNGNTTVQYNTVFANSMTNTQNYIPGGDNYSRRWDDSKNSGLQIHSDHEARFLTGKVKHEASGSFDYGTSRSRTTSTEGTFSMLPGDWPSMRSALQGTLMPDTFGILNRYLSSFYNNGKQIFGKLEDRLNIGFRDDDNLFITLWGGLSHNWSSADQQYLLQYAGQTPNQTYRTNPQNAHGYNYGIRFNPWMSFGDFWTRSEYSLEKKYSYTNTMYYDFLDSTANTIADPLQQWQHMERMQSVLDPGNSYFYGQHVLEQTFSWMWCYEVASHENDGSNFNRFQTWVEPEVRYLHRTMDFHGFNNQSLRRGKWLPAVTYKLEWNKSGWGYLQFLYQYSTEAPKMFDLLDISLNSDPLNPTMGNPDLKDAMKHRIMLTLNNEKPYWNILSWYLYANYDVTQRALVYGTSYDRNTGIRTTRPENINGNRGGEYYLYFTIKPLRDKRFSINFLTLYEPRRYATLVSPDGESALQRSLSRANRVWENIRFDFRSKNVTASLYGYYENRRNISLTADFTDYTTQYLSCGANLLVRLPLNFEVSTNASITRRYGYTEASMNRSEFIWNARITKSIMKGSLQFVLEGYDMLNRTRDTYVDFTPAYRRETHYNSLPRYFMFSVKYFFSKKPRK